MQHQPHAIPNLIPYPPQPVILQLNAPRSILAMHIPKRRRQPVNPRRDKLLALLPRRQHPLQLRRVRNPVLPAFNPSRFRLCHDPPRMAVGHQLPR